MEETDEWTKNSKRGYGFYCVGCDVANIETIEQGAKAHNLDNEEIGLMLKDMNTVALEK